MNTERSTRFLMANLGSEVSRILNWKEKGDMEMAKKCLERAEGILEQVASAPDMRERREEITLLKDVIEDLFRPKSVYSVTGYQLKEYFLPFATRIVLA